MTEISLNLVTYSSEFQDLADFLCILWKQHGKNLAINNCKQINLDVYENNGDQNVVILLFLQVFWKKVYKYLQVLTEVMILKVV